METDAGFRWHLSSVWNEVRIYNWFWVPLKKVNSYFINLLLQVSFGLKVKYKAKMRTELSPVSLMSSFISLWGALLCYIPNCSLPVEHHKAAVLILNRHYLLFGLITTSSFLTPPSGLPLQSAPRLQAKRNPPSWLWAPHRVILWGNKEGLEC